MALELLSPGGTTGNQCATPRGGGGEEKKGDIMTKQQKCETVALLAVMYYADTNNKFDMMVEAMTACGCDFSEIANDLSDIANRIYDIIIQPDHDKSNTDNCRYQQMSENTCTAKS